MQQISLTANELEIMNVLWENQRPLSRSEIIQLSPNRSWKANSIHILLNKLMEKKAITVDGFVKTGKNYGRTFIPLISHDDYFLSQLEKDARHLNKSSKGFLAVFASLLGNETIDEDTLAELETMIENKKKG